MIELLISIMLTLGIQFTKTDSGKLQISNQDAIRMESSELFQKSGIVGSIDEIVINDGIDPSALSTSGK